MRTEPDLKRSRLLETLRARYLLDVTRLTFIPFGLDSWSYVATCRDGRRVFVKLSRRIPATNGTPSELPLMAALAVNKVAVPRPLADRDGGFLNVADGYEVQVLEYLEGRSLEDETAWSGDLYAQVAEMVAAVHASTSAVRHLVDRVERYELPFLRPFAEALAGIEAADVGQVGDNPTLATLRQMVLPRARELRVAIGRLGGSPRPRQDSRLGPGPLPHGHLGVEPAVLGRWQAPSGRLERRPSRPAGT